MLRVSLLFSIFLLLVFLQSISFNQAQTQQTQQSNLEVRPFTDLTLEIVAPEQTLLSLQPIPVIIKQSNRTNQPVLGYKSIGFGFPIYLYAQKSGGERVRVKPLTPLNGLTAFKNSEIPSGDSYEAKEWITIGLKKYFPEPGTYELQAVLANADGTQFVESNKINIEIQAPTGADRNAYNLIKNSSFQDYLFSGAEFDKVKNTLETLTTGFPNSVYAKSSFYLLGEIHFHNKRYPQALANLIRLENDRDFIFSEKIRKYLAEIRRVQLNQQENP